MSTIASAYVQILPSTKGIKGQLTNELNGVGTDAGKSMGNNLSSSLMGVLKSGALLAAGAAVGKAFIEGVSQSVREGGDLQQSIGGIQTLFKDSANTVMKNAQDAWKTAGVSANDYMENVTSFSAGLIASLEGDTRKAAEVADMAMQDMSDNANKMGTDIGMIQTAYQSFARQQYMLLDNLKLGYGGTKTEMERLLSDAEKLSGVKYDISNLSDVYNAIHVIQQELGITGATAEEASTTLTGSFNAVKAALQNVLGEMSLGSNISKSLQDLGTAFNDFFNKNLIPMIANVFKQIPTLIGNLLSQAFSGDGLRNTTANITKLAGNIVTALVAGLVKIQMQMPTVVMQIIEGLSDAVPALIASVGDIIEEIIAYMPQTAPLFAKEVPKLIGAIVLALINSIPALLEAVGQIIVSIIDMIPELIDGMSEAISVALPTLSESFAPLSDMVMSTLEPIATQIGDAFAPAASAIETAFAPLGETMQELFRSVSQFAQACAGFVITAFSPVAATISSIFNEAVDSIKSLFSPLGSFMTQIATQMKQAFEKIVSRFRHIGQMIVQNLKEGITGAWENLMSSIRARIQQIIDMFDNLTRSVNTATRIISMQTNTLKYSSDAAKRATKNVDRNYLAAPMINTPEVILERNVASQPVNVNVTLSGSAKNIFDTVRVENNKLVTATGYKALA